MSANETGGVLANQERVFGLAHSVIDVAAAMRLNDGDVIVACGVVFWWIAQSAKNRGVDKPEKLILQIIEEGLGATEKEEAR